MAESKKGMPNPPGEGASAADWEKYLNEFNSMNRGEYRGGDQLDATFEAKDNDWEEREDNGEHSPYCPINLGTALTGEIDQMSDRPVEREVFGED
jgi:hypothetical protein